MHGIHIRKMSKISKRQTLTNYLHDTTSDEHLTLASVTQNTKIHTDIFIFCRLHVLYPFINIGKVILYYFWKVIKIVIFLPDFAQLFAWARRSHLTLCSHSSFCSIKFELYPCWWLKLYWLSFALTNYENPRKI